MLPCPPACNRRTGNLDTFVSFLGFRVKRGKTNQFDQMASRAKGIIFYSMNSRGYVDVSVQYVCILEDMSIYEYIGVSVY